MTSLIVFIAVVASVTIFIKTRKRTQPTNIVSNGPTGVTPEIPSIEENVSIVKHPEPELVEEPVINKPKKVKKTPSKKKKK